MADSNSADSSDPCDAACVEADDTCNSKGGAEAPKCKKCHQCHVEQLKAFSPCAKGDVGMPPACDFSKCDGPEDKHDDDCKKCAKCIMDHHPELVPAGAKKADRQATATPPAATAAKVAKKGAKMANRENDPNNPIASANDAAGASTGKADKKTKKVAKKALKKAKNAARKAKKAKKAAQAQ